MPKRTHSTKVPAVMQEHYQALTKLTDEFCQEKLNDDYQEMACYMVAALCRKRPSPLASGKLNIWACAVLYALGTINFLFDKSQSPYITTAELVEGFGISKSSAGNKAKQIREILKMNRFDHHWCLPSLIKDKSVIWMISFNGFIVDARQLPAEIQKIAYEKGLIPYIHAENC